MNIVFDLGGVVFKWQPDTIISCVFSDGDTQQLVRDKIFKHPDWIELDRGTLTAEEAIERGTLRTGLPKAKITQLLNEVPKALEPIEETIRLLHSIKDSDNKFYVLSNMHTTSIKHLEQQNDFWGIFEGKVISCYIQKVKPEPAIYQYLLEEFDLEASDTVFIDDLEENLIIAAEFGIKTIQFENADQCKQALQNLGCI